MVMVVVVVMMLKRRIGIGASESGMRFWEDRLGLLGGGRR